MVVFMSYEFEFHFTTTVLLEPPGSFDTAALLYGDQVPWAALPGAAVLGAWGLSVKGLPGFGF